MSLMEAPSRDERWELASQAANEGIWDWDMRTNKVYRSDCWFRMFGYEPGELADTPWVWENLIHPDDAFRVIEQRRHHIEGLSERYYVEHRMRCKDGVYRWFLSRGQVIRDEQGMPVRMLGFYTNIQETIETRARLLRQNAALQILNEISLQAIASDSHDVTLTTILNRIRDYIGAEKAYLALYDPGQDLMVVHSMSGYVGPSLGRIRLGEHFIGLIWQTGEYQYKDHFNEWPGRADTPDASQVRTACGVPLKLGGDIVGVISLGFLAHRTVSEEEVGMLHQVAAIAALVARNRQMALRLQTETEQRESLETTLQNKGRAAFLNALVDGKTLSARELAAQAKEYRLSLKPGYIAMAAQCDCSAVRFAEISARIETSRGHVAWQRDGRLYALVPCEPPQNSRQELIAQAEELRILLESLLPGQNCSVGVGLYCADLKDLSASLRQASDALEIGSRIHTGRKVHHYLEIGLVQELSRHGERPQVEAFIRHSLGRLIDYDRQNNAHLMETLAVILNESSLRSAAEALYVHTKTMLFRKNRIEEILGDSLDDPAVRLNLTLALQLYELRKGS